MKMFGFWNKQTMGRIGRYRKGIFSILLLISVWMMTGCTGKTTVSESQIQETPAPLKEAVPESLFIRAVVSEILGKEPEDIKPEDLAHITCLEFSESESSETDGLCEIIFFLDGEAPAVKDYWEEIDLMGIETWLEKSPYRTSGKIEIVYDDFEREETELSDLALFSSLKALKLDMRLSGSETDLSPLENLRTLSSGSYSVDELGRMFSEPPKITELTLDKPDSLEGIDYFANLEYLAIESLRAESLEGIEGLTKLVSFRLSGLSWTPVEGLDLLARIGSVENISFETVENTDLSFLKDMKQLKKLSLKDLPYTDLSFLEGLSGLEQLKIDKCKELQDISVVSELTGLTGLRFTQNEGMKLPDFSGLANMKRLDLTLFGPFDLKNLASMTNLEYLVVSSKKLFSPGSLQNMTELKKLYLINLYGDEDVSHLFNLQNLELLDLSNGTFSLNTGSLASNAALKHLYLSKSVMNGGQRDFSFLVNYPNLINLNLNGQQPSSLDFLDSLTMLEGFCINPDTWEAFGQGKEREGLEIYTISY